MRDPKRIEKLLGALRAVWTTYPDLRLGQMVVGIVGRNADPFYVEDDIAEARLREYLGGDS